MIPFLFVYVLVIGRPRAIARRIAPMRVAAISACLLWLAAIPPLWVDHVLHTGTWWP